MLEIIDAHETALEFSHPAPSVTAGASDGDLMGPVLGAVVDPLVEMCERSAEALTPDAPSRVDEVTRIDPSAYR